MTIPKRVVQIALGIGCVADLAVGIMALFFQSLTGPLFDLPTKDPAITTLAGGEIIVAGLIYVMLLRDPVRFKPFFWLVCLDQVFAGVLVAYLVIAHDLPPTLKLVGPIPLNLVLAAIFAIAARSRSES